MRRSVAGSKLRHRDVLANRMRLHVAEAGRGVPVVGGSEWIVFGLFFLLLEAANWTEARSLMSR